MKPTVGVLALQGAFGLHAVALAVLIREEGDDGLPHRQPLRLHRTLPFALVTGTRVPLGSRGDSTIRPERRTGLSLPEAGATHSEATAGRSEVVGKG